MRAPKQTSSLQVRITIRASTRLFADNGKSVLLQLEEVPLVQTQHLSKGREEKRREFTRYDKTVKKEQEASAHRDAPCDVTSYSGRHCAC